MLILHLLLLVDLLLEFDDTGLDPRVLEGLLWCHTLLDLPFEALIDEIYEHLIIALHHLGEVLRVRVADLALAVGILQRTVVIVEEDLPARSHNDHGPWRQALDLHNALDLLLLVLARKNREADVELVQDTAK